MRIHNKLMVNFLVVCLVPLVLVSSLLYCFSVRNLDASAIEFASVFNPRVSSSLNQFMEEYGRVTKSTLVNNKVIESLNGSEGSIPERVGRQLYPRNVMMQVVTLKSEIREIMLLTQEDELYQLGIKSVMMDRSGLESQSWFQEMQQSECVLYVTEVHGCTYYDRVWDKTIVAVTRKTYNYTGKYIGVLILDIDPFRLIGLNDDLLVVYNHHNIRVNITGVGSRILYDSDVSNGLKSWQEVVGASFSLDENDSKDYLMIPSEAEMGELEVNTTIPRSRLPMSTNWILHVTVLAILLRVPLIQFVSWHLSRALTVPIIWLQKSVGQVEEKNYNRLPPGEGEDELNMFTGSYNQMVWRIRTLIEDVYPAKIEEKEAKYLVLQAQINSYMLYNTLEATRMRAPLQGVDEIADMIKILSKIFRVILDGGREISTIGAEIEYAQNYAQLQNLRFKNHFLPDYQIETGPKRHPILSLLVRLILENNIRHGDKDRSRYLHMNIEVTADLETIRILITDDGCSMSKGQAGQLNEKPSSQEVKPVSNEPGAGNGNSVGPINIAGRIFLHYSEKGHTHANSEERKGMSVEIGIPWKEGVDVSYFSS